MFQAKKSLKKLKTMPIFSVEEKGRFFMVINRLDGINPLQDRQAAQKSQNKYSVRDTADSINLSDEARELAEAYYASQVAKETPDVRADRIAEIKEKIKDPSYINSAVIDTVANRIMDAYGI